MRNRVELLILIGYWRVFVILLQLVVYLMWGMLVINLLGKEGEVHVHGFVRGLIGH